MKSHHNKRLINSPSKKKKPEEVVSDASVASISVEAPAIESSQNETQDSITLSRRFQYYVSIMVYTGIVIASIAIFLFIQKNA